MGEGTVDGSLRQKSRRSTTAAAFRAVLRNLALTLSLATVGQSAFAQAMYRIKPLGWLAGCTDANPVVRALNKADEVTGYACIGPGQYHAFLWKNNGSPMRDLGPSGAEYTSEGQDLNASGVVTGFAYNNTSSFAFVTSGDGAPLKIITDTLGGSSASATGINDLGQVTGYALASDSFLHAFLWKNDGSPMRDLGTLGGSSLAYSINASGQVVGAAYLSGNAIYHAFVWRNDGTPMVDLGTLGGQLSEAILINSSGQVAGDSLVPANSGRAKHAFFWRNDGTPMQDLGTLGGAHSYPSALNDSGQIAGFSDLRGSKIQRAFVWMNDGTPMKDLGTFGGANSKANGMNASGQVTGYANLPGNAISHAFLWSNDGLNKKDLNGLVDPTDPLKRYITLNSGSLINDLGDIVAAGTDSRTGQQGSLYLLQGTVLTLSPRALDFGNQPVKTSSAARSVNLTNTGAKLMPITSMALTGYARGQFAFTDDCGSSLAGHATCTVKVIFKPTSKGAKSAALNVNGGGGGLRVVALSGTGT